jgi:O-methyltransferase
VDTSNKKATPGPGDTAGPDTAPSKDERDAGTMTSDKAARLVLRNERLKEKMLRVGEQRDLFRRQLDALLVEYESQRRSYYLSNYREKIDISDLPVFSDVARMVIDEERTGMNFDRLYTLWQGVMRVPDGCPVIEVGSYKGGSAKFIAETLRRAGRSPRLYVCDTFQGHARLDPAIDGVASDEGFRDTSADSVREYLDGYSNVQIVVGDIIETSAQLTDASYGFVHIDVDVYPPTAFCLDYFAPRLAAGGLMVIDDYGVITCPGAQRAVDDFARANPAFCKLHLLTGQALVFKAE